MSEQPTGTVTLLFTDIEGSTRLLERLGAERYRESLELHRRVLRDAFRRHEGYEVDYEGDAFFVAFRRPSDAVAAAAESQQALARTNWPEGLPVRVRMGIHTGAPLPAPPKYVGLDVHKAARIMAAGHGGQVLLSASTRGLLGREVVVGSLGEHRLKDLSQPEPLYQLQIDGISGEFPALKTLGNRPNNLPVVATPFIGRGNEVREVVELMLRNDVRLLTLTGPGGIGKTRLALQAAADVLESFRSGVFWVPLASVREHALVVPTVAQALALREEPGESIDETLSRYLADKELLLALDNFEHVVDAASEIAVILTGAPNVRVLCTSREALRLQGEHLFDVPPLPLPVADDPASVETVDAVQLFVSRARAVDSAFAVTSENAAVIAAIVRRLDGIPLALELAAARSRELPPQALLRRLDSRLGILTSGSRDADERQRTLRATVEWSYNLLPPEEQTLFDCLSVFVGGCGIEAAEAVCGESFDGLASLLQKSLLRRRTDPDGEPRYWMLETIREYAAERLEQSGLGASLRERHSRWVRRLLAATDRDAAAKLRVEQGNLRAALSFCVASGRADDVLRHGEALYGLWDLSGQWVEGRGWLAALREHSTDPRQRVRALAWEANLAQWQGDNVAAGELAAQGLRESDPAADPELLVALNVTLGEAAINEGRRAEAQDRLNRALTLSRDLGDDARTAYVLGHLVNAALYEGDFALAAALARETLTYEPPSAKTKTAGLALYNLGFAQLQLGETDEARESVAAGATLFAEIDSTIGVMFGLESLAAVAARDGDYERAVMLAGASARIRDDTGVALEPLEQSLHDEVIRTIEAALPIEALERAYQDGWVMSVELALEHAVEGREQPEASP